MTWQAVEEWSYIFLCPVACLHSCILLLTEKDEGQERERGEAWSDFQALICRYKRTAGRQRIHAAKGFGLWLQACSQVSFPGTIPHTKVSPDGDVSVAWCRREG